MREDQAKTFGHWLRELRLDRRLTMEELGKKAGVSKQYISVLERAEPATLTGKPTLPKLENVEKLARALEADIGEAREKAGYTPRNGTRAKPQNAAEFAQRLADMGFEIQTDFNYEKLGPDDLQDVIDQIEANLLIKARRKAG